MNKNSIKSSKNQTENEYKKTFNNTVKSSFKVKKIIFLCLVFIISYTISIIINGFEKTNLNLLYLVIFGISGFALFYLIYGVAYLITKIKINIKSKRNISNVVNCDEEASIILNKQNKTFTFDKKISLNENLSNYFNNCLTPIIDAVADNYGKKSKTSYLNFSVYDGIDFLGNVVDATYYKIDVVLNSLPLSTFNLTNKPIVFLKNFIIKSLYENEVDEPKKPSKVKEFFASAALTIFNKKINSIFNEITEFCALEGVKIFSKNGKTVKKAVNENE